MNATFTDNFSKQAVTYQKYRPTYPAELFSFLSSLTNAHDLAWDCGTGNGQSAVGLAEFYRQVYATDPSRQQLNQAIPHARITYKAEQAEHCGLPNQSADLITIAQAIHWFDFEVFYAEAKRVLKPNGIIAAWTYNLPAISPEIDGVIRNFHDNIVGAYWQAENKLVEQEYATIPFPFEKLTAPDFTMQKVFSLADLLGLLTSWSAVQKFRDQHGSNPVEQIKEELNALWGDAEKKKMLTWKLFLKVGRNSVSAS